MLRPRTLPSERRHAEKTAAGSGSPISSARSWAAFCLLGLLLAAGLQVAGAVDDLALRSLAPGELEIDWDVPASNPTDYRVNWAPVDEDFPSYRDDSGNAYPTQPPLTLQGLDPGVEYKVQVRARYGEGHAKGITSDPWSASVRQVIDEYGSDADSAGEIDADESAEGSIDSPGDEDRLGFEADAGTSYFVELEGDGAFNAVLIGVYDGEGNAVGEGVTWSGVAALLFTPQAAGTYYASAAGLLDEVGDYDLWLENQSPQGLITGLDLSRNASGDLTVTWDAPSPAPRDYRVGWALLNESYPSWRDDSANAYPTAATHTITGLVPDQAYKIYARARYAGTSGPWARAISGRAPALQAPRDDTTPKGDTDDPDDSGNQGRGPRSDDEPLISDLQTSVPEKPTGLEVTQDLQEGMLTVQLTWADPQNDSITKYEVRRGISAGNLSRIAEIPVPAGTVLTTSTDGTAQFGTTYFYDLRAENGAGFGDYSDAVSFTTMGRRPAPQPPIGASAEATDSQVTLSWLRNPADFHVAGYRIKRGEDTFDFTTLVHLLPTAYPFPGGAERESYVDADVLPGVDYHYRIHAVNEWGESPAAAWASATTAADVPPGLRAEATRNSVTLSWDDPEDPAITAYRILRSTDGDDERVIARNVSATARTYVDSGLQADTAYAYRMQAIRGATPGVKTRFVSILTLPASTTTLARSAHSEPAGGDVPASAATAARVQPGEVATGRLTQGDRDWFALDLVKGETYHIEIRGRGTDPLPQPNFFCTGTVQGSAAWVSVSDRRCWEHVNKPHHRASLTGRYFISITSGFTDAIGDYEIEVRRVPAANPSTTASLTVNTWASGELLHGPGAWYRIRLYAGRDYRIHQFFHRDTGRTADGYSGTPRIRIFDQDGELANRRYINSTSPPTIFRPLRTAYYFVGIEGRPSLGSGRYRFRVEDLTSTDDLTNLQASSETSSDDLPADPTTTGFLPFGQQVTGDIHAADDRDWFRVRFDDRLMDRLHWIEFKGADTMDGTLGDPFIAGLFDANGVPIPYSWTAGEHQTYDSDSGQGRNAAIDFTPHLLGDFYVEVGGERGATGTYTLSLTDITDTTKSETGDLEFDSWNSLGQIRPDNTHYDNFLGNLALDQPATGTITADPAEPEHTTQQSADGYFLRLPSHRNYRIEARGQETNHGTINEPNLVLGIQHTHPRTPEKAAPGDWLFDFIWSHRMTGAANPSLEFHFFSQYPFNPEGSFNWLISIEAKTGTYTLEVTDITDSGDDCQTPSRTTCTVTVGGSATGNLDADGDGDYFRVYLEKGKQYRIRMQGSESAGGTLADPAVGVLLFPFIDLDAVNDDKNATEKDAEIVYEPETSGEFVIEAYTTGTGTGTYTISVEEVTS